jgi:hypothetical protein
MREELAREQEGRDFPGKRTIHQLLMQEGVKYYYSIRKGFRVLE